MVIDQRNAGASVTPTATGTYLVDRFNSINSQSSKFSAQQNAGSVTPPVGFKNYLGITSLSAYSIGASETFGLRQLIEGYNVADLGWGTANAKTVTLSFQVYSSLTGTFGGALTNASANRFYPFSYSIPVANIWTSISVTIAGDTTGTWATDNSVGISVTWSLGTGSTLSGTAGSWGATAYYGVTGQTNIVANNTATFYITGCQLEVGTNATNFEYRPYGTELALCQRYFYKTNQSNTAQVGGLNGTFRNTTTVVGVAIFPVTMRAAPTATRGGTSDTFYVSGLSATASYSALAPTFSTEMMWAEWTISGGTAAFNAAYNGQQSFTAEL